MLYDMIWYKWYKWYKWYNMSNVVWYDISDMI